MLGKDEEKQKPDEKPIGVFNSIAQETIGWVVEYNDS